MTRLILGCLFFAALLAVANRVAGSYWAVPIGIAAAVAAVFVALLADSQ